MKDACRAEHGYVLARAHWGKDVATAAVLLALAAVFGEEDELQRVKALVDVANLASQQVLEKTGFRRDAVLRRYCMLKGDFGDMVIFGLIFADPVVDVCFKMRLREVKIVDEEEAAAPGTILLRYRVVYLGDLAKETWIPHACLQSTPRSTSRFSSMTKIFRTQFIWHTGVSRHTWIYLAGLQATKTNPSRKIIWINPIWTPGVRVAQVNIIWIDQPIYKPIVAPDSSEKEAETN